MGALPVAPSRHALGDSGSPAGHVARVVDSGDFVDVALPGREPRILVGRAGGRTRQQAVTVDNVVVHPGRPVRRGPPRQLDRRRARGARRHGSWHPWEPACRPAPAPSWRAPRGRHGPQSGTTASWCPRSRLRWGPSTSPRNAVESVLSVGDQTRVGRRESHRDRCRAPACGRIVCGNRRDRVDQEQPNTARDRPVARDVDRAQVVVPAAISGILRSSS